MTKKIITNYLEMKRIRKYIKGHHAGDSTQKISPSEQFGN